VEETRVSGENHQPVTISAHPHQDYQGLLNSIICPRAKQCTGVPTFTTTCRNKNVNVDKIKHIFIVLVFPTKSVFNIKKT
jgi:hypothetical protein